MHILRYICVTAIIFIFAPNIINGQNYFTDHQVTSEKSVEKTFFEHMDRYMPAPADGTLDSYVKNLNPAFFEGWIAWIMEEAMIPGISLCFLKDGELYWKKHLGYANLDQNAPVNDSTLFLTCSISKTIVVTSIMQLYEAGLFNLDDDINEYLPFDVKNPNYPDSVITFRHLLTHLSSINDDLSILNALVTYGYDSPIPLEEFLSEYLIEGGIYYTPLNYSGFPPQVEYNYSNVGASLLAYLVEVISKTDFETYCQENIFVPLGMEQTSFRLANLDTSLIATPYLQQNDTLIPSPHPGFPVYPAITLRTSASYLSRILSMYMKGGSYNQVDILQDSTIDLITTLQYPEILTEERMGLIWFYKYGFFKHGGYFPGAQAEYGFSWDKRSGLVCIGNSANPDWSWFMEFLLLSYAHHYKPFSVETIILNDSDDDNILEPGEDAGMALEIRNNINITETASNIKLTITTDDPNINIEIPESFIGELQYLETKTNIDIPFLINIGMDPTPYTSTFNLLIEWGDDQVYQTKFKLEIGQSEILLVDDGTSFGGLFIQPDIWYEHVLDSLGREVHHYDLNIFGDPSYEFISNFPIIIWFSGFQSENTLNEQNQEVLSMYLDNGGKLFLSGQNISEDIQETTFLSDYLHVKHINDTYEGQDSVWGLTGDPIGDNLLLTFNQAYDAMFQFSMSEIEPVNGGECVFHYFSSNTDAAVRYENSTYKTLFFGFGFEGINNFDHRLEVMQRILEYFDETVTTDKGSTDHNGADLKLIPNPFSSNTQFSYFLEEPGEVTIKIFDLNGRNIQTIMEEEQHAGAHSISFEADELSPGVYFYNFRSGSFERSGKLIIMP